VFCQTGQYFPVRHTLYAKIVAAALEFMLVVLRVFMITILLFHVGQPCTVAVLALQVTSPPLALTGMSRTARTRPSGGARLWP
jgi:hypothetical protein